VPKLASDLVTIFSSEYVAGIWELEEFETLLELIAIFFGIPMFTVNYLVFTLITQEIV
jgi:hypothetical protein